MHDPDLAQEVAEARRLGGLRRREVTLAEAYEFGGLGTVEDIRRFMEIAAFDTLGLDNSIARSRAIAYLCQVAYKGLEVGQTDERLAALEDAVRSRDPERDLIFDATPTAPSEDDDQP